MTTRTKTMPPAMRAKRSAKRAAKNARTTGTMVRQTWGAAVNALTAAEEEMARQVKGLMRRNRITAPDARAALKAVGTRLERERKVLGKTLDSAVHRALASINVPSRQEVAELTRKVEELSRRIEKAGTRTARRGKKAAARA
jgi:polyhydroxyalkanoate synthesis regulator phasin